ncbi:universal stress protein [Croceivirga lutea]|uniref:universal stress protein n=1 Tax=Croceivirga lutea TaxID=1775167 RepID=UPI001639E604|nr:universal stress protein [Croceivirga lutea]GGG43118.1 universal stress protein [Croceivirga lutea]
MKHVLIPTDFSDNAWNAIRYGMELFKKSKCTFYLLHVSPISPNIGEAAKHAPKEVLDDNLLKDSWEKIENVLHKIESLPFNTKHTFETLVHYGYFSDTIKQVVLAKKIDLIIMGTKGASGLKATIIGSNTGNVLTKVKCPVLAIPENAHYKKPKEIAFPTDFNLNYDLKVLDDIKELLVTHNASLRVLYISKKGEELLELQLKNKEFLYDYFSEFESTFHQVTSEKLETAVQCFTESRDIDIIVMVAKNLNFLQRILFKPTVEKISYHTNVPFFVVHE